MDGKVARPVLMGGVVQRKGEVLAEHFQMTLGGERPRVTPQGAACLQKRTLGFRQVSASSATTKRRDL